MLFKVLSTHSSSTSTKPALTRSLSIRQESFSQVNRNSSVNSLATSIDERARQNTEEAKSITHIYNLERLPHQRIHALPSSSSTELHPIRTERGPVMASLYKSDRKLYHPTNEDYINAFILQKQDELYSIINLTDGHGPGEKTEKASLGTQCSQYVCNTLEDLLKTDLDSTDILESYQKALNTIETFLKQTTFGKVAGTTFLSVAIKQTENAHELSFVNVGDSRAIILKQSNKTKHTLCFTAECCTIDQDFSHLSDTAWNSILQDESTSLRYIKRDPHYGTLSYNSKTFLGLEKDGYKLTYIVVEGNGLNMSHTMGNHNLKLTKKDTGETLPINSMPNIYRRTTTQEDKLLILASDGLWAVRTPKDVADFVSEELSKGTETHRLSQKIVEFAYQSGSTDDLSVVVYPLNEIRKSTEIETSMPRRSKRQKKLQMK